mmetsp:Transcript_12702/g.35858  ORF Transcript_12702/g.35858 Transcript_12702/m.35858 type:complete len:147 (+) Transcript_12702:76-516(+)|eukprot:CAMPEP_0119131906 /NCGR_PEP_ID=MMETSP1310-20130426/10871_1 /TAXON_ID=464262 /ORGANISM="Genus nov. species nov., Strain RCC2339" /LENGTH=146 /DNA_ID=CAMNT_0007122503 /DNA_START=62 /DNA_END=502 /DNA_ORIENTATION=+
MNQAKLARLQQNVRIGGKGTARRKRKAVHKSSGGDDKKLQLTLNKLGTTSVQSIEQVNMFRADGMVLHFTNPKVQAAFSSRTCVVTGAPELKSLQEILPEIIQQLGPEMLGTISKLGESASAQAAAQGGAADADDELPDLVDADAS